MNAADDASGDTLGDAIAQYLELERSGSAPTPAEFARGFPHIETRLRRCLELAGDLSAQTASAAELPREVGGFLILRELGRGGMGVVFEAEQKNPARRVALKMLLPWTSADPERRRRFQREVESTARLRHPSIVAVLEAGQAEGVPYYAMPLLQGASLERVLGSWRVRRDEAPLAERARLVEWLRRFIDVARALDHAHGEGVLHRDIKPSNLFLEDKGVLAVLDFGLTRSLGPEASSLTQLPVGTPRYMSPEQIRGAEVDARSDQFSFAATLYEVLTLEPAFAGTDRESVFHAILHGEPRAPHLLDARIPRDLEVILLKGLEKEPQRRYVSMEALADDLERFLAYEPIRARPASRAERVWRRARRNPVASASLAIALLSLVVLPLRASLAARERTRALVEDELAAAREARARLTARRVRIAELEQQRTQLKHALQPWSPLAAKDSLWQLERELAQALEAREQDLRESLTHGMAALRLAPNGSAVRSELAATAFEEFCAAERAGDVARMRSLATLVETYDDGALAEARRAVGRVSIASDVPDTQVFLFRYQDLQRLRVPVPVRIDGSLDAEFSGAADVRGPWSWIELSSVGAAGLDVRAGDELLSVCGLPQHAPEAVAFHVSSHHGAAHVLELRRAGVLLRLEVEPGTALSLEGRRVEVTPYALRLAPEDLLGHAPIESLDLPIGSYLAVLRSGPTLVRVPFELRRGEALALDVAVHEAAALGAAFVYVPRGRAIVGGDESALDPFERTELELPSFWLQRFETTFGEYFEFLAALEQQSPAEARTRAPRQPSGTPLWTYDEHKRIAPALPPGIDLSYPLVGVNYRDALAYARWRSATSADAGFEIDLPTELEWEKAARGSDGRRFVWGDRFDWALSRLGRTAEFNSFPHGGLYPADESPYGARDMNGCVREWCRALDETSKCFLRGGAWAVAVQNDAHLASRGNEREGAFLDTGSGVRLVARRKPR